MTVPVDKIATSIALGAGAITSLSADANTSERTKIADLVFSDDDGGSPGTPNVVGEHFDMFEVEGNVLYLKAGTMLDPETADRLNVSVQLTEDSTVSVDVSVDIIEVEAIPTITTSFIAVNPGGVTSITLTDDNINFTDSDAPEDPANIIYTITRMPTGATLGRNNVALSVNGTFTHQDILNGWVALGVSDEAAISGIRLTIADSADTNPVEVSLNIQVREVADIATPERTNNVNYSEGTRNLFIDTGDFNDQIRGSRGSDFIIGGLGDDDINLDSGDGNGSGQDTVVYNFGSGSVSTAIDGGDDITGFRRGEDIFLLRTVSDNPELATLDGLFSYLSGPNKDSSHDDNMLVRPNYETEPDGDGGHAFFFTGITFHFEDAGLYGNNYPANGFVSITFDERLPWAEFLSLIEIDNRDGTIDRNFNYDRGSIRDLSVLPNLMGEGSLAYEGTILPIAIAPSGVNSVEETPLDTLTQGLTEITYFVLTGVATEDLRLARINPMDSDPNDFFQLDGNVLYLKSGLDIDYDSANPTLDVRIQHADDRAIGVDIEVEVENVDDVAPVFISGTLVEFNPNTTVVYDAVASFDRTRIIWSFKEEDDDDHGLLDIDIYTGQVSFKEDISPDPENETVYSFTVVAESGAFTVEQQVTIYPTGYTLPVIADTAVSIRDTDVSGDTEFSPVMGAFMSTSGVVDSWMAVPQGTEYGTLSVTDNRWVFTLNQTGKDEINGLNADSAPTLATFDVSATNALGDSDTATLTISLQGYSPTGAPVLRNDDVDVVLFVDNEASGQIGFIGDVDGTTFARTRIDPIGRHDPEGNYAVVASTSESTGITGTYGTLTLRGSGSWAYALRYDDPDTMALGDGSVTETFSLGYRSSNDGDAVQDIDITVTNLGALRIVTQPTLSSVYSFLPAFGRIEVARGDFTLDSASLSYGVGRSLEAAKNNLDSNFKSTALSLSDGGQYGTFVLDSNDGSWTYTTTESQDERVANDLINPSGGLHDHGDLASVTAYIAVRDASESIFTETLNLMVAGADLIEGGNGGQDPLAEGSDNNEFFKGRFAESNSGVALIDNIVTGEGNNGVAGLGGDDIITLGNGSTPTDAQIDVVYHRVEFLDTRDPDGIGDGVWRTTDNVDGRDTIDGFIRNEDQFIFIEWDGEDDSFKVSEEDFLANTSRVLLTPIIEPISGVFTLTGFKIGFFIPAGITVAIDFIKINYHIDHRVALTTADILEKYGLTGTDTGQQITGIDAEETAEVRHNYFGDINEDSFQVLDARPPAVFDLL